MHLPLADGYHVTDLRRTDGAALVAGLYDRAIYERTLQIPFPYTVADAEAWLDEVERRTALNGRSMNWALRDPAERLIGTVGTGDGEWLKKHRIEIGYWLAKPYWGRGLTTAAVRAICDHLFAAGYQKLTAQVFAGNEASARVLVKCGFVEEGFLRGQFSKDGVLIDVRAFGLLRQ